MEIVNFTDITENTNTTNNSENVNKLFFNSPLYSNIKLRLNGSEVVIYGHKPIIAAQCQALKPLLTKDIVEINDVCSEPFLAFLMYLYSSHSPGEYTGKTKKIS